ncbi:poly(R)-hydroxyalkanoic acid synthase subunit PhaE [Desulfococcaceae bacterium HSG8]|nr:poly(R)-hydroxyalkanoic acid synthase subunit PhaE [Desulfococcaceae bacterium HSG8]
MDQSQKTEGGMESLFAAWTKSVTDFWGNMAKMQPDVPSSSGTSEESRKTDPLHKARKGWETSNKVMQSLFSSLTEPENMAAMMKGMDSMPEFVVKMTEQSWDGYLELQKQWADHATRIGKHTEAYRFDDIDQNIFRTWKEIYEKEFQKFLHAPQLGLTRFHQERVNRLMDKYSIFRSALNEFIYMFYIPIEKSVGVMQEKIDQMADQGDMPANFKDYYNMWIRTLEGHYMTLLKSPEYTQVMDQTIDALVQYRKAKEEVLYDFLQDLPIPTNQDMDELYKDFYLLKKQVRELSKKVNREKSEK